MITNDRIEQIIDLLYELNSQNNAHYDHFSPGGLRKKEDEIYDLIEQSAIDGGARTVDVQVTRLRRKIEQNPRMPRFLQTVRGRGYTLRPE